MAISSQKTHIVSKEWLRKQIHQQNPNIRVGDGFVEAFLENMDTFTSKLVQMSLSHSLLESSSSRSFQGELPHHSRLLRIGGDSIKHTRSNPAVLQRIIAMRIQSWLKRCEMLMLHANRNTLSPGDVTLLRIITEEEPLFHSVSEVSEVD